MQFSKIPASWGEIVDKLTILEIKKERIIDKNKLVNIDNEYKLLSTVLKEECELLDEISYLLAELKIINEKLWEIEDKIREKEKKKLFDMEFIELARMVYITNDRRASLKAEINEATGCFLKEEKSYSSYILPELDQKDKPLL